MSKRQPPGHTRTCSSCGRKRGKSREGWQFYTDRDDQAVAVSCPDCPAWDEPIRRLADDAGVRFRVVVDATPAGAPRRKQATRTLPTLAEARAFVETVRADVRLRGGYADAGAETVAHLAERWLRSRKGIRPVSVQGYRDQLAPPLRWLGSRAISSVTDDDVNTLVEWLSTEGGRRGQPLGARAVRSALGRLSQAFDVPVREGTLRRNVFRDAERPRMRKVTGTDVQHWTVVRKPGEVPTCPDRDRFRATADADKYAAAWRLALLGMTRADVLGLRWSDVDLDAGTVTVRQGRVSLRGQGTVVDDPKSAQRRRTLPVEQVEPGTLRMLRSLQVQQGADRLRAGEAWEDTGLVVVDALGRGISPGSWSRRFHALRAESGAAPIRLHALRHTLALYLIALGVPPHDAAAWLGHTLQVFMSTYLPDAGPTGIGSVAATLSAAPRAAV